MKTFEDLALIAPLLQAVEKMGYEKPTPIQAQAIPPLLEGRDVLGCAKTGTGKTAAFTLPVLQKLHASLDKSERKGKRKIAALILSPTRELAAQIDENIRGYSAFMPVRHTVIFGGVNQRSQVNALNKGVDILTACPGRLLDLMNQGYIDLADIEFFALDECDRMLDMGFIHDVQTGA